MTRNARSGRILIVGAGGHGQVVADILHEQFVAREGSESVVPELAFLDADPSLLGTRIVGIPVVGTPDDLPGTEHAGIVIALGDNRGRADLAREILGADTKQVSAVHPSAIVARSVRLGAGVMICAGAVVNPETDIGDGVIVNTGSSIDHHCSIAAFAHIAPGAHLGGTVTIGTGALVGLGASVLPNAVVGEWAVVGAGAVVVNDVAPGSTVLGCPAGPVGGDGKVSQSAPRDDEGDS